MAYRGYKATPGKLAAGVDYAILQSTGQARQLVENLANPGHLPRARSSKKNALLSGNTLGNGPPKRNWKLLGGHARPHVDDAVGRLVQCGPAQKPADLFR